MDTPAAEVDVDETLVRALLREQHPDLAHLDLSLVGNGWDNAIFRLGQDLVVRLPRRRVAAELVEHEQRWLPEIAARVSVPVPSPVRVGAPSALYRWAWTVAPWFDGDLASNVVAGSLTTITGALARFIRELHTTAPDDAPLNPVRGVPLAARAQAVEERLSSGSVLHAAELSDRWKHALAAPEWPAKPVWLHGDLHPANLLVRGGHLAAVLDFGDVCGGDPATDLAIAWLAFDDTGRAHFRSAVGYDDATWLRAEGWAILMGTAFLTNSADNPAMNAIGTRTLERVLKG